MTLIESFRCKAGYFTDGHNTKSPASITYTTIVSRYSVHIILTIKAMIDFQVLGANAQNTFLTAYFKEKGWLTDGIELGSERGNNLLVVRAFYGLKSASASLRAYMANKFSKMGF